MFVSSQILDLEVYVLQTITKATIEAKLKEWQNVTKHKTLLLSYSPNGKR